MCKQLGGKTLQHMGIHEVGLFNQDSHYSICLVLTLCLLSNLVKINEEHFLGKVRYVFLSIYAKVLCKQINYSLCFFFVFLSFFLFFSFFFFSYKIFLTHL